MRPVSAVTHQGHYDPVPETPIDPYGSSRRRRARMTAVLQARVTEAEMRVLEHLARRQGLSMSDAVRAGVWSYLLAGSRPSCAPPEEDALA